MSTREPIVYLDNNATTQPDSRVVEAMLPFLREQYGNPSSGYRLGKRAAAAIEQARAEVAALIGCEPEEMVFTSGGTESNHSALLSTLHLSPERRHLVTTRVEHSAILSHSETLARLGFEVTLLDVDENGALDLDALDRVLRPDTALVSIMAANNETGVLFPITEIAERVHAHRIAFHTDTIQAAGKIPLHDFSARNIHFLSLSAHKFHGPKGVGALYVNRRTRFTPLFYGGGQEHQRRAGTENVPGIVGMGKAAALARESLGEMHRLATLRDHFETRLLATISGTAINGHRAPRLPNTSNVSFEGIESEGLLLLLDRAGICASAGSACTTGSPKPSHVLTAMGQSATRARSAIRFSLSRFTTADEIDRLLALLPGLVAKLRR